MSIKIYSSSIRLIERQIFTKELKSMKTKNYLILCAALVLLVPLTILFTPGLSDSMETRMLTYLMTNAR
jgi:hypothetical protein